MTKKWMKGIAAGSILLSATLEGAVDFTKDVMPILEERCLKCHGHIKESGKVVDKGDLDITKPESIKEFLKAAAFCKLICRYLFAIDKYERIWNSIISFQ